MRVDADRLNIVPPMSCNRGDAEPRQGAGPLLQAPRQLLLWSAETVRKIHLIRRKDTEGTLRRASAVLLTGAAFPKGTTS